MTDEEIVKKVYPNARVKCWQSGVYGRYVIETEWHGRKLQMKDHRGMGYSSEEHAWSIAAYVIKREQE